MKIKDVIKQPIDGLLYNLDLRPELRRAVIAELKKENERYKKTINRLKKIIKE